MEREILFVNLTKGEKNGNYWHRLDYVIVSNFKIKSDFISSTEYENIKSKVKDNHFIKAKAILSINDYDKAYVSDLKLI